MDYHVAFSYRSIIIIALVVVVMLVLLVVIVPFLRLMPGE
jgi:PDZ domain-containing secreted protein